MRVAISNFKSVDMAELELAPLTILLGPPAGGKSNILDAMALAGYLNRLLLLDKEYGSNVQNLEPLTLIARFSEYTQLFRYHDLSRRIVIDLVDGDAQTRLELFYESGKLNVVVNGVNIPWDLRSLAPNAMQNINSALRKAENDRPLIEARLYGYDRYGLASSTCTSPANCGFHLHLKGAQPRSVPVHIMSEFGWNATTVIKSVPDTIVRLNEVLRERIDEEIDVRILRTGVVVVFDYGYEVEGSSVSDSIFRALYYLMAMRSAVNYVKIHGLENRFVLLLEEPEAHIFPFFLNLLAEYIAEAIKVLRIVIATHNPLFVSKLWDIIKDVRTYYVYRDREGSTKTVELDIEKLTDELRTAEDILYMSPSEVVEKYSITKR